MVPMTQVGGSLRPRNPERANRRVIIFLGECLTRSSKGKELSATTVTVADVATAAELIETIEPSQGRERAQLLSLVQHIELNKAGWWERTIQTLIIHSLWLQGGQPSEKELLDDLLARCGMQSSNRVREQIKELATQGALLKLLPDRSALSTATLQRHEQDIAQAETFKRSAQEAFAKALQDTGSLLDPPTAWQQFLTDFFEPTLREYGAQLYRFLNSGQPHIPKTGLDLFADSFPPEHRKPLHAAVRLFLHPCNQPAREFVVRSLNAYFCLEATNLSKDVIGALTRATKTQPTFELFVDTNFLLDLIGIRDHEFSPIKALLDLIAQLKQHVHVRLKVLPITIDETKRVVSAAKERFAATRLNKALAIAAQRLGLDPIAKKFLTANERATTSAETYFAPYLNDLLEIIRCNGAEFHNTNMDAFRTDQHVIDDLLEQLDYEKKHYAQRPKGYEQLEHDLIAWHFVQRRRPNRIESPLEARAWILTLDNRLIAFDAHKTKRHASTIPVCMHPATLIQLLQFWTPRTAALEEAICGSLGLPFFQDFDGEGERITDRILETLSRFEDASALPHEAATRILMNDALRQKLTGDVTREEQTALIKDVFCRELKHAIEQRDAIASEHARLTILSDQHRAEADQKSEQLSKLQRQLDQRRVDLVQLDSLLTAHQAIDKQSKATMQELEQRLALVDKEKANRVARVKFGCNHLLPGMAVCLVAPGLPEYFHWHLIVASEHRIALTMFLVTTWSVAGWLHNTGSQIPAIAQSTAFQRFSKMKKHLFALCGILIAGAAGNAFWEFLKMPW